MNPSVVGCNSADPQCPTCGSKELVKSGHNSCKTQQFLCKNCGAHRVLSAKSRAADPERKAMVLRAVQTERLSMRAAQRRFGVARQTIAAWLRQGTSQVAS